MTYNRSEIMKTANAYAKTMSLSAALRKAWAEAKLAKADHEIDLLSYCDRFRPDQRAEWDRLHNERARLYNAINPPMKRVINPKYAIPTATGYILNYDSVEAPEDLYIWVAA